MLVRRSPGHACVAHVRDHTDGVVLLRVTPDRGTVPFWSDLEGQAFPDRPSLRGALLARMRAQARGEPLLTTLDRVLLSRDAYAAWMRVATDAAPALSGLNPDDLPDETAEPLPDGTLRISVALPSGAAIVIVVPADQWAWRDH
jgi:hypothetical protein